MKYKKKMKVELERLERYLRESVKAMKPSQILRYLIKGIIKYEDGDLEGSIHILGKCVVLCQGYIVRIINANLSQKVKIPSRGRPDFYFKTLHNKFFKRLMIEDLNIVSQARKVYSKRSKDEHKERPEFKHHPPRSEFPGLISTCIKQFLLTKILRDFIFELYNDFSKTNLNRRKMPQFFTEKFLLSKIDIRDYFNQFFQKESQEIIDIFLQLLLKSNIKDSLRERKIIKERQIKSSAFLQKFFPLVPFEDFRIERILDGLDVIPFRPDGPTIVDFKSKEWVFIPQSALNILEVFKIKPNSILISAPSGYGKTVITRYLGYKLSTNNYKVFYVDLLKHEKSELKNLIDRINYNNRILNNPASILFIFENIHVLNKDIDKDILKKLNTIKDKVQCVFTQRIFPNQENELELTFNKNQLVEYGKDSVNYKQTISGMVDKNAPNSRIAYQLKSHNFGNLWVHALLLKTHKTILEKKADTTLIEIFKDTQLIGDGIGEYFKLLLISKHAEVDKYEYDDYINVVRFLLAVISIFSELELWVEKDFIKKISNVKDSTPLGRLNSVLNIDQNLIKNITSFLMKIHEIEVRQVKYNKIFDKLEFKIPHSQMALIYKNCFLNTFEDLFSGLTIEIMQLYLAEGSHYGNFIRERSTAWMRAGSGVQFSLSRRYYISFSRIFQGSENKLKEQILRNSITEFNRFVLGFSIMTGSGSISKFKNFHNVNQDVLKDYQDLRLRDRGLFKETLQEIFQDHDFLKDSSWKTKMDQINDEELDDFLDEIRPYILDRKLLDLIINNREIVLEKFKNFGGVFCIRLALRFINSSKEDWYELFLELKNLIDKSHPTYGEIQYLIHNSEFEIFEKIEKDHFINELFQIWMRNFIFYANIEDQLRLTSVYNYFSNPDFFSAIYLDIIRKYCSDQEDLKIPIDNLIIHCTLRELRNFLLNHQVLGEKLLEKHIQTIKKKIELAEITDVCEFFDSIMHSNEISNSNLNSIFLKDWDWFKELFIKLNLKDLNIAEAYHYLFPYELEEYEKELFNFLDSLIKKKIKQNYERLEDKVKIHDLLRFVNIKYQNEIILLFRDEINATLGSKDLNYFTHLFREMESQILLKDKSLEIWDVKQFILDESFQKVILNSKQNEITEFFSVILERFYSISIEVINTYEPLIRNRLSIEDFIDICIPESFSKESKIILKALKDKDFTRFCMFCNSQVGQQNLYSVPNIIFDMSPLLFGIGLHNIKDIVLVTKPKYLSREMKEILLAMSPFSVFNLLVIFCRLDERLYTEFLTAFKPVIREKLNVLNPQVANIIAILGIYRFKYGFLNNLEDCLETEFSLALKAIEWLNDLDLLTLRVLTMRFSKVFGDIIKQIDLENILKNSSIMQISMGLVNYHAQISIKKPPQRFFLYNPRMTFEVFRETFDYLTGNLKNFIRNDILELEAFNQIELNLYTQDFDFFSGIMLEKLMNARLEDYYFYFKCLNTWGIGGLEDRIILSREFVEYLNSPAFNQKFLNLEASDMLAFLGEVGPHLKQLPYLLFKKNQKLFLNEDYIPKLESHDFLMILKFYSVLQENLGMLSNKQIDFLKRKLLESNFYTLITIVKSVKAVAEELIDFLFDKFRAELDEIIINSSRSEIWFTLNNHFHIQKNEINDFIFWLVEKFPFFDEKLKEKYFFDL